MILPWLISLGERLDLPQTRHGGSLPLAALMRLLKIRDREGKLLELRPNRAQQELARDPNPRKIVLKARQLGLTTYIAARFFLRTVTRPGTLTVQVAHDQESAEEIFKIVRRFHENLPEALRAAGKGAWRTSRANVRQLVFPALDSEYRVETAADPNAGRGLTIQNLHCSEVARSRASPRRPWHRCAQPCPKAERLCSNPRPTAPADVFIRSGNARTKPDTRATFFPGGMRTPTAAKKTRIR